MMHPDYLLITQEIIDVLAREAEKLLKLQEQRMILSASLFFKLRLPITFNSNYVSPNENQRQFNGMKKVA
jgi:hypothetical protein